MHSDGMMVEPYPGYCMFLEDVIQIGIAERNLAMVFDAYENIAFFEDGDEDPGGKVSESLIKKMQEAIKALLDRLSTMAMRISRTFSNLKKEKITAADYRDSDAGQAKFEQECIKIAKQLDRAYIEMRPVVGRIAKLGGDLIDPKDVEELCDKAQQMVIDNRTIDKVTSSVAKGAIKGAAFNVSRTSIVSFGEKNNAAIQMLRKKEAEIEKAKLSNAQKKKQLALINRCANAYSRMLSRVMVKQTVKEMKAGETK